MSVIQASRAHESGTWALLPFATARLSAVLGALMVAGCPSEPPRIETVERSVYSLANGCFALSVRTTNGERYLAAEADGTGFRFTARSAEDASRIYARAADLGTFVLRDGESAFALDEGGRVSRAMTVHSDTSLNDDAYISPAEWDFEAAPNDPTRFRVRNRATTRYLAAKGPTADAARAGDIAMTEATGCIDYPELSLDATGAVTRTHFDDGDLFGVVDAHSHLFTNFGFGGGGVIHGSPFHRLGVEHALPDCNLVHGDEGRRDLLGYVFDGSAAFDVEAAAIALLTAETPDFNHHTEGYPEFTDWPNGYSSSTHQTQYYRWIERSYLAGLRLIVQHGTSNQVLCEIVTGVHAQEVRTSCNEMVGIEREIDETYALERYIDAQSGGPGLGWFRVVKTPAEARAVIGSGKLAVVLGIETSNLFDCYLTPHEGFTQCDDARVRERLDHFQERGVRAIFPVHKFDNAFSAGDGHRGFIQFGSFINTGHYSNYTTDCDPTATPGFDRGSVTFGGLNMPRDVYDSPAPVDISGFAAGPIGFLFQHQSFLSSGPLVGEYCQKTGLTPLGENLITEMMRRGMILELDHLPNRGYARAMQMLTENDYPAAGTHGTTSNGALYALGGISVMNLPRCGDAANPDAAAASVRARIAAITAQGGYGAQGFGFDFNGLAHSPRPRFGAAAPCATAQANPIIYPFTSYAGDVVLHEPHLGSRTVDFDTEGMLHIGLMPELIEDARHLGVTDADLEPLFRSAEGYIRMWERAEARGAALRAGP